MDSILKDLLFNSCIHPTVTGSSRTLLSDSTSSVEAMLGLTAPRMQEDADNL